MNSGLKAPYPWFGGKSTVADEVWKRFGDVRNFVEPFFGSGAVLLGRPLPFEGTETVNDLNGWLCLAPDTKILRNDMTWAEASDIRQGDMLVGFDEHNGEPREGLRAPKQYRRWKETAVISVQFLQKPCYRLTFDDGTTVVCSSDHLWLGGSHATGGRDWRWQTTEGLVPSGKRKNGQRSWVMKAAECQEREDSWEAGWLGGFADGEGHLVSGPGWSVSLHQRPGEEIDRAEKILRDRGYTLRREVRSKPIPNGKITEIVSLILTGGMREVWRFLMQFRPARLIQKAIRTLPERSLYGRKKVAVGLAEKKFLGVCPVIAIETDSHTFIAEGLASHNCNFWRALQADPEAVARYADWPVSELDLHARGDWLFYRPGVAEWIEQLRSDPDFYDAKSAGWWVWGQCCWIGTGWGPRQLPRLGNAGRGVNRQLPHLGNAGRGVNRKLPHLGDAGQGGEPQTSKGLALRGYLAELSERLRGVRICCGDFARVCTPMVTKRQGLTAVFCDPPYAVSDRADVYDSTEDREVSGRCRKWCMENGADSLMRIAYCGYREEGVELEDAGWTFYDWKTAGGYASQNSRGNSNRFRETIWFSPNCIRSAQVTLF